ncbi:MAG: rRNA pseudouridine synthase [Deltaproteobacteria bacterium]|nr:rRNA pseudouridine synthase [Deltaproteobacteria bacterium]
MAAERLQKVLSRRGVASRREAEAWILAGRVRVNGAVVTELGTRVDPAADDVEVDGEALPPEQAPVVVLLHKPAGYVTTVKDPHAERTVMELLVGLERRVYPVGRLDRDTRGVLILTDDGDLAHTLLHPSRGVEKVYDVWVRGELPDEALTRLAEGVELRDGHVTRSARVSGVERGEARVRFQLALKEGHKRQVREMVRAVGGQVANLARISFGGVTVDGLDEGAWRLLTPAEVARLKRSAGGGDPLRAGARGMARPKGWATRKGREQR